MKRRQQLGRLLSVEACGSHVAAGPVADDGGGGNAAEDEAGQEHEPEKNLKVV